jgi:hypothetical protein
MNMNEQPDFISHDVIASRARQLWETEGKPEGKADEHWSLAEAELRMHQLEEVTGSNARPVIQTVAVISRFRSLLFIASILVVVLRILAGACANFRTSKNHPAQI